MTGISKTKFFAIPLSVPLSLKRHPPTCNFKEHKFKSVKRNRSSVRLLDYIRIRQDFDKIIKTKIIIFIGS